MASRDASGIRRTVSRDSAGRITGYTHTNAGTPVTALDQTFAYDNLNRLVSATQGATTTQYSYDATGNRTAKVLGGTSYPNTISASSNKLTQTQDALGTNTVLHDSAGNITSDGLNTYSYTDRGRLAAAGTTGGTVTYAYNALEQRVGKSGSSGIIPTGAAYYVYDEAGKLLGEYDASGNPVYETIYLGAPIGVIKQTGAAGSSTLAVSLYNVHTDQIGAPKVITRQSDEAIVWRWDTAEAFGATAPDQNPSSLGTFTYNPRIPGQVFDQETGLFQNWFREYNPRIGRYMQSDPIGLAGGINTFSYVEGDPLGSSDPMGLAPNQGCVAACTAVGGVIGGYAGSTVVGAAGGVGGAAGGTLVLPVGGTIAGGVAGGISGATWGGIVGAGAGSAVGNAVGNAMCPAAATEVDSSPCSPPVGTQCYQGPDTTHAHAGLNPHYHIFQMFKFNGTCQWKYLGGKVGKGVLAVLPVGMAACSTYSGFQGR